MTWHNCLKVAIILLLSFPLLSQHNEQALTLRPYAFKGLTKTKDSYLLDIIKPNIGSPTQLYEIEEDVQILRNLPSVAKADYTLDTIGSEVRVTYQIEERKTALPIVNLGGIKGNIWFSLGFIENNFRGNGDVLLAYYQNNNGLHSGQIYFRKPRISGSNWGYSFSLDKWSSQEPIFFPEGTVQYYYNNNGIGASLLRNIGLKNQIELGGTYFKESYEKIQIQDIENPPGPNNFSIIKFLTKLQIKQNYIDYHYFYLSGFETILNYQNVVSIDTDNWFNSLQLQGKLFLRPSEKLNLAFRLKLAVSTNDNTPFAPFVADSHINIRGIGNRIDRGTAQIVLNLEGRYTLKHTEFWSSQLVVFADNGNWRNPGGSLDDLFNSESIRQFIGAGIRFNYQKVFGATLRVDYGIDLYDHNQRGLVIGLGQYF